ncbi:MAG: hypothetical protein SGARI_002477 [Bacillariaceae sp.]
MVEVWLVKVMRVAETGDNFVDIMVGVMKEKGAFAYDGLQLLKACFFVDVAARADLDGVLSSDRALLEDFAHLEVETAIETASWGV